MPNFDTFNLLKSLHVVLFSLAGGSAAVILLLVGFEESREDLHGLTAVLWKRTAAWGFRLALLLGIVLLVMKFRAGAEPFQALYIHWKLVLVVLLLMFSEMSPKALAARKRGAPMLAFVLFRLTVLVSVNHDAFGFKTPKANLGPYSGTMDKGK